MNKFKSPTDFVLNSVKIHPTDGRAPFEIKQLVNTINYVEAITAPFLSITMEIVDSGGLLQKMPIKGAERVEIEILTNFSQTPVKYNLTLWKIANRYAQNQKQAYTIGLISSEALNNEVIRIENRLEGNPESIVGNLLSKTLKTQKTIFSESSKFDVKILGNNRRPFDLIASMCLKCVSPKAKYTTDKPKIDKNNPKKAEGSTKQTIKGTGGFYFWESRRGYNFYSIDSMCADENSELKSEKLKSQSWGPYIERLGNQDDGADNRFAIYKSVFGSEIDIVQSLRFGKYSTFLSFFNHSTGQYEEYVYSIKDSYDNMAHLGGQESISLIPSNEIELSSYPTKRMSFLLDHETWYNDPTIASPDPKDGSTKPSPFADWHKFYAAQSLARYQLLKNQSCTIVVPGNPDICAGDKVDIRLMNKLPNSQAKNEPFDQESSGVYLVNELTHTYDTTMGANGKYTTTLRLVRDSYGMKGKPSSHDTK